MTAVFLLILLLNCLTVKTSDDLGYSIHSGLADLFHREYIQYMTWTGRTVAHLLARTFLSMPKAVFNLCNSFVFVLHAWLISFHACGHKEAITPQRYLLAVMGLFLFAPVFGQTVLWETGSCNYLWTATIILIFLYFFRQYGEDGTSHRSSFTAGMFFLGVAAGWTNENTGGAGILMALFLLIDSCRKGRRMTSWMISGLIGALTGFMAMILAPGNAVRAADFVNEGGRAYVLVHDLFNALNVLGSFRGLLALMLGFGAFAAVAWKKKEELILPSAYVFCGAAAVAAIILSPVPVEFDRSMFGAAVFVLIGTLSVMHAAKKSADLGKELRACTGILCVCSLFAFARAVIDLSYTRYQYNVRENWVSSQKALGNRNPVVPEINSEFFTTYNAMYGLNDLLESKDFVNNRNYALTHGIDSVTSTTVDKWNLIYRNGDPLLMNETQLAPYLARLSQIQDAEVFVTSSYLDESYAEWLKLFGTKGTGYLYGRLGSGLSIESEPGGKEEMAGDHYVWINASKDPAYCDILIDGQEAGNDRSGITLTCINRQSGQILDTVTFCTESGEEGSRHYDER